GGGRGRAGVEQDAAARRRIVAALRHEGANAIERVGGDAPAVAQAAGELAVIDGATAEGRFGEPLRTAEVTDLLKYLLVHERPLGTQRFLIGRLRPCSWPQANQRSRLGSTTKVNVGSWAEWVGRSGRPLPSKQATSLGQRVWWPRLRGRHALGNCPLSKTKRRAGVGSAALSRPALFSLRSRRKPFRGCPGRGCRTGNLSRRHERPSCGQSACRAGPRGRARGWDPTRSPPR